MTRLRDHVRHLRIRLSRPLRRLDAYEGVVVVLPVPVADPKEAPRLVSV